jgi:hypothetical protein
MLPAVLAVEGKGGEGRERQRRGGEVTAAA